MQTVRLEMGPIATLTLSRPDRRNAMTREMGLEVAEAVRQIDEEPSIRVVLVRGAGKSFCAGGDFDMIEQARGRSLEQNRADMRRFYSSFLSILRVRVPTIGVVHGAAMGAGLCFACACDLRVAADDARFGANFVRIGLHPGMAATVLLPRLVGAPAAAELLLTGRTITGTQAAAIGLVQRAVPTSELDRVVGEIADQVASAAPIAVSQCKRSLQRPLWREIDGAIEIESYAQAVGFASDDVGEAIAAFREGRSPSFAGH